MPTPLTFAYGEVSADGGIMAVSLVFVRQFISQVIVAFVAFSSLIHHDY